MTLEEKVTKLTKAVEMLCEVVYDLSSESDEWGYKRPETVQTLARATALVEDLTNEY